MNSKVDYDSSFYILKRILKEAIMPNILPFGIAILLMLRLRYASFVLNMANFGNILIPT